MAITTPKTITLMLLNLEHDGGPEAVSWVLPERWLRTHREFLAPRRHSPLDHWELVA
ncbi:hypothetical protein ABT354_19490 [Streptomyces sp. NPDC000594]|uniref:hypothetical protein n=1 Tax=Streptomyces sp. NPDC000594 TaxID=3154261 RepID=UPI00331F4616